jgi:hypothetical protein
MTSIDTRIDAVIASDLAIRLKGEGYRKSGRTFFRVGHEHTCIVNVQGNKWNQDDEGSFAINLGVYFPIIADLGGGPQALGPFPKEHECSISTRLGPRAREGDDHWWPVGSGDAISGVAAAVGTAWSDVGRAWLEEAASLTGAYAITCERSLHFPAAIFALALRDREKSIEHLKMAIERLPRGRTRFEAWGKRYGLIT